MRRESASGLDPEGESRPPYTCSERLMRVFVDSDSAIAQAWADRVFETYRNNSDVIDLPRATH